MVSFSNFAKNALRTLALAGTLTGSVACSNTQGNSQPNRQTRTTYVEQGRMACVLASYTMASNSNIILNFYNPALNVTKEDMPLITYLGNRRMTIKIRDQQTSVSIDRIPYVTTVQMRLVDGNRSIVYPVDIYIEDITRNDEALISIISSGC